MRRSPCFFFPSNISLYIYFFRFTFYVLRIAVVVRSAFFYYESNRMMIDLVVVRMESKVTSLTFRTHKTFCLTIL